MAMKVTFKRDPLFGAARIVEQLEEAGVISSMKNGQRKVL